MGDPVTGMIFANREPRVKGQVFLYERRRHGERSCVEARRVALEADAGGGTANGLSVWKSLGYGRHGGPTACGGLARD